jgi:iron complex outermembrane receptor protein
MIRCAFLSLLFLCAFHFSFSQTIKGTVKDAQSGEALIGANVVIKGTVNGTVTDEEGNFSLRLNQSFPVVLTVSYLGYLPQEIKVKEETSSLNIRLNSDKVILKEVSVTGSRLSEKARESPLTVESMDVIAIRQTPAFNFYEGVGQLKGVDVTSASLGFKIVNTRGFNSTSPVRSLQIIDGVDNQAPGLNFSLGNFLGAPDLDVLKVDLVVGASSAFYGPNAFNGVISMTTKDPFLTPGLTISLKGGERSLFEGAIRWDQVIKNKQGEEKFAYKINGYLFRAYDWEATNLDPIYDALDGKENPGGYDAVNRYGDEFSLGNDYSQLTRQFPGLGRFYRTGYLETDLVDYNTRNYKVTSAFHYKIKRDLQLIYASNFGSGTTVYQGDNRYSLKNVLFFQNRLELNKPDKFFIRAYATNENAGDSYDAYFTALLLQQSAKSDNDWSTDYSSYYIGNAVPDIKSLPGYPGFQFPVPDWYDDSINTVLSQYLDTLFYYHDLAEGYANDSSLYPGQHAFYLPGTNAFDSAFQYITTHESYSQGGSKFFDKSALYHIHGEYKFTPKIMDIVVGANFRQYRPNSHGTIFSDTGGRVIKNSEYGVYAGLEKRFVSDRLKINLTMRMDKNQNFNYLFSPAASAVYSWDKQVLRFSFSSAIRNPTLADQYLFYNVGPAILVGNLHGFDSLVTIPSLFHFFDSQNKDTLVFFNVKPVRPEEVKTAEVGYRASLFKHLFVDMGYYYNWYRYFIGYKIGADIDYNSALNRVTGAQIYRVAANTKDMVTTSGFSIGLNYYFKEFYMVAGNYTYNKLNRQGSTDPIIPAYNTPENKFNIGISGRDIQINIGFLHSIWKKFPVIPFNNYGFSINYKWVQGFLYEGSPQFTGFVPEYGMVDAQVNKQIPKIKLNVKIGASNLLNNKKFQVYGGPYIGRLAYVSAVFDLPATK